MRSIIVNRDIVNSKDLKTFKDWFSLLEHWCARRDRLKKHPAKKSNFLAQEMDNRCRKLTKFIKEEGKGVMTDYPIWFMHEVDHVYDVEEKIRMATDISKRSIIGKKHY